MFPLSFPGGRRGGDSDLVQIRMGEGFPQSSPCPWVGGKKEVEMGEGAVTDFSDGDSSSDTLN